MFLKSTIMNDFTYHPFYAVDIYANIGYLIMYLILQDRRRNILRAYFLSYQQRRLKDILCILLYHVHN